jgi:hypothetical protein
MIDVQNPLPENLIVTTTEESVSPIQVDALVGEELSPAEFPLNVNLVEVEKADIYEVVVSLVQPGTDRLDVTLLTSGPTPAVVCYLYMWFFVHYILL